MEAFKAGFVALIGKPNVGKSTIMNTFLGQKLSIVSDKPETTIDAISGIVTTDQYQIVFRDTPGIHRPKVLLGKYMVSIAKGALLDTDVIVCILDATSGIQEDDRIIIDLVSDISQKLIVVINKVDKVRKSSVLPLMQETAALLPHAADTIPLSALTRDNMDILFSKILEYLPVSEQYYPKDQLSDRTQRYIVGELIREKVFCDTYKEIPHACFVVVDEFREETKEKKAYIRATIYVEKDSQKAIVIGKSGVMLKKIGWQARESIEAFLGQRVYLDLWVKVMEDWRKDEKALRKLGFMGERGK